MNLDGYRMYLITVHGGLTDEKSRDLQRFVRQCEGFILMVTRAGPIVALDEGRYSLVAEAIHWSSSWARSSSIPAGSRPNSSRASLRRTSACKSSFAEPVGRRPGPDEIGGGMGLGATVGADLLAVPFPKMVFDLARAIANGQTALDRASIIDAAGAGENRVRLHPGDHGGDLRRADRRSPRRAGDRRRRRAAQARRDAAVMSCCRPDLTPSFYQFTESVIEVKMSISSKVRSRASSSSAPRSEASPGSCSRRPRSAHT